MGLGAVLGSWKVAGLKVMGVLKNCEPYGSSWAELFPGKGGGQILGTVFPVAQSSAFSLGKDTLSCWLGKTGAGIMHPPPHQVAPYSESCLGV
jgi:hypothetical protein